MMQNRIVFLVCLCVLQYIQLINCHSWLACTDYAEKNARYYNHDLCRGYARSSNTFAPRGGTFGQDLGFDHRPSENQPCKRTRNDATEYNAEHPMAVYYQGQQVVLAHPMKNHGSDTCTNGYIPDNGNFIYRGGLNDRSDLTLSQFRNNIVADLGVKSSSQDFTQYPKPGYQNAPAFCENTDKSLGTYSFNVPSDLTPGRYTFLWVWSFNSAGDLYSSCFEVDIVSTLADRNAILMSEGISNTYEPCGGLTSNFNIPGNTNPDCTETDDSTSITTMYTPSTTSYYATTTTRATPRTYPTTTTTATTTTAGRGETLVAVQTLQMGGEISLPRAQYGTMRRYISVHWDCPVIANFWNIRVIGQHNVEDGKRRKKRHVEGVHYDLMQEGDGINTEKFYYHAMFTEPCDLKAYPPIAKLIRDEY